MATIKSENTVLISGRQVMGIPQGGAHVRAVEIRLNQLFRDRPMVIATIHSNSPGTPFGVSSTWLWVRQAKLIMPSCHIRRQSHQ